MKSNDLLKTAKDLVYLVSCAVNGETPEKNICDKMNLDKVLKLARNHSLSAAAAIALENAGIISGEFREEKFKAVRRLSLLNTERGKVLSKLEDSGIWYLPLKGIVLKDYYPKTAMREMSDNDILFDCEKYEKVKDIMEGLGFKCKLYGKTNHDVYKKPPQLDFEMHRFLFDSFDDYEWYNYFKDIKSKLVKDDDSTCGYHMTNEDLYIYLICHLRKHYVQCGTGLRSLLDIYMFRKKFNGLSENDYIQAELKRLDLSEFEQGMSVLASKVFGFKELSEQELDELMFFAGSNTHGTKENLLMQKLSNDDSKAAKRKYALRRIFPSRESLRREHPFVYRHAVLYPFWIMYRPIRGFVKYPNRMFGEIKGLREFKKKENRGRYNE